MREGREDNHIYRSCGSPALLEDKPFQFKDVKLNINMSSSEFPSLLSLLMFRNPSVLFNRYSLTVPLQTILVSKIPLLSDSLNPEWTHPEIQELN